MATKFASVMGWELLNMLLSTPEGTVKFARLQQCIAPPEEVVGAPSVLFPLLLRTAKALLGKKPSAKAQ